MSPADLDPPPYPLYGLSFVDEPLSYGPSKDQPFTYEPPTPICTNAQEAMTERIVRIAVMGTAGSGKSTFINLVSGSNLRVSNRLGSCTEEVTESNDFELGGRTVRLLDTPGFDDTDRSEVETLKKIATSLEYQYRSGIILHGIIYLHRISDNRMGGASTRSFRLFQRLCGDDVLENVVIATNMWSKVCEHEGGMREQQLITDDRFFKSAMDGGARIFRHDNTVSCALDILRPILDNKPRPLAIQRELVNEHRHICDSEAGREVNHRLRTFTRRCTEDMISLKAELEDVIRERDEKAEKELSNELQKLTTGLARAKEQLATLTSDHRVEEGTLLESDPESRKPGSWGKVRGAYHVIGRKSPKPQGKVENVKEIAGVGLLTKRIVIHHKSSLY